MRAYKFDSFGLENLRITDIESKKPGPGEIAVDLRAVSLNYRDLLVIQGLYNPNLSLPTTPISEGSGIISSTGPGVTGVRVGDEVITHFVSSWIDGTFEKRYLGSTLGAPGPGLATERVILPENAVLPMPKQYDFAEASTLSIAALTAWSVLVTEGNISEGDTVLTLGTGGVSIFAIQLAKAMKANTIITSSSNEKLKRSLELAVDHTINYIDNPRWDRTVLEITDGRGVDIVCETGGITTMNASLKATAAGGLIGVLGGITGLTGEINIAPLAMKRLRVIGVLVDSRVAFEKMLSFLNEHRIKPIIDRRFPFEKLRDALSYMKAGKHFGKIVVEF